MPTGNEYSDVRFGQGDQSYKQTDREMSGGVDGQAAGPNSSVSAGSYPSVFDGAAGSEPLGPTEGEVYYPQKAYEFIECTGPGQSYVRTERESVSGEYGQCGEPPAPGPYPGNNMVPDSVPPKQFSSRPITYPKGPKTNAFGNNINGSL